MNKPNKRKRAGAPAKQTKRHKASQPPQLAKRTVHVDSLRWKNVEIPDMLDDAEGFFGLEEVEGVDIVRHGQTVQFVAAVQPEAESDGFEGFDDPPEEPHNDKAPKVPESAAPKKSTTEPASKATKTKNKKQKKDEQKQSRDPELESNLFSKMGAAVEPEEDRDMSEWVSLDLSPQIVSAISRLKFSKPTPIQARAIPEVLSGHDVIGKASTGSGKTLAFGIPIVEDWLARFDANGANDKTRPIALVLSPTRELAHQITNHMKDLCSGLPVSPYICSVTGGLAVQKQQRQLEKADIIIGTPGRLWEVLNSDASLLSSFQDISYLVVDEADRLLSEGHFKEAEEIFDALDRTNSDGTEDEDEGDEDEGDEENEPQSGRKRQTLVFSATFNKGLQQKLAGKARYNLLDEKQSMEYLLKKLNFRGEPKFIDVNPTSQMAERLKEGLIECGAMEKDLYLYAVLMLQSKMRTLVFTNSISSVRRLTPLLQNLNLPVLPLHSEMPQKARLRSVERFTANGSDTKTASPILVATDVAARGLDIPGIDLVVHYHVPRTADAYVHRSGRTARAQTSGISILLCAPEEVVSTRRLVARVHSLSEAKTTGKARAAQGGYFIRTIDIDRKLVSRLRERVVLAKTLADSVLAKDRGKKNDDWMKNAAEELGVDYDSEELESAGKWIGRGSERKKKEKAAQTLTKAEIGALRAELRELLSKRVNVGVSEKYLGRVDVDELLRGVKGEFLGSVEGLGLDDL